MSRRVVICCLMICMLISTMPMYAFADPEMISDSISDNCKVDEIQIDNMIPSYEKSISSNSISTETTSMIDDTQPKGIRTKLLKKIIRFIIKHKQIVVDIVKEYGGKSAAKAFEKHFNKVCKELKVLLDFEELTKSMIRDAAFRGMINAGVKRATATKVAHAIYIGLDIILELVA